MLKVLWIVNILFPEASALLGLDQPLKYSGGWLLGAANALRNTEGVQLAIATPSSMVNKLECLRGDGIAYYVFPLGKGNTKRNNTYRKFWREIRDNFRPNIVHIHGTEMSHGLAYIEECGAEKVVVSIQGLISVISDYYNSGLTNWDIISHITVRDLLRRTLYGDQRQFQERGILEKELLSKVHYVIGRTNWDYAHTHAMNPQVRYFACNETLRQEYYTADVWSYTKCTRHTIFLSQSSYPLKGLHMVLRAMPYVLKEFPDATIRVAGEDITRRDKNKVRQLLRSGYGNLILSEMKKYGLIDKVSFVGYLDANEMIREYRNANVFVCPSSMENSPNSLGEAQLLGVPVVASYVGGVPDMMRGNEENLYRFEEIEMLAANICRVFKEKDNQGSMRKAALKRHDAKRNNDTLLEIYKTIVDAGELRD